MSARLPVRLAMAALLVCAAASPPARADEALARRLAALRALADPGAARAAARSPARPRGCPPGAWWRASQYAIETRTEKAIRDASLRYALDDDLLRSVIRHESAYDPEAVSHKGAQGLMQLMPDTARELGVACAFDPRENVLGGARYLRQLYDRFGAWDRAIAAYHAGPQRVETGRIPGETRRYVRRVLSSWNPRRTVPLSLD